MPNTADTGAPEAQTVSSAAGLIEALFDSAERTTEGAETTDESQQDGEQSETTDEGEEQDEQPTGDEADQDEDVDEDEQPQPRRFRVKDSSGEHEVTEDELVKGYLRQADYTRKTQAHAEEVRKFQPERDAVVAERQAHAQRLADLENQLKSLTPQEPNWEDIRKKVDPATFGALYAEWGLHQARLVEVARQRQEADAKVAADQLEARKGFLADQRTKLMDAIPEWKDEKVKKADYDGMIATAKSLGFDDNDINSLVDHRMALLLRKAYLFDKQQAAKPNVRQRLEEVRSATPSATTGKRRAPVTEVTKAKQRLAQTGRVKDAAALMELLDS